MKKMMHSFLVFSLVVMSSGRLQALEFRRHPNADSNKLNAILATGKLGAGDADRLL